MKVAIFTETYEPVQNGVSTSVRTLVDELRSLRHRVLVVTPHYPDHEDNSPFILRVPSILTPFNPDFPVSYPFFPRLRREFGRTGPDVLHTHHPWFLGVLAARLAQRDGLPLVATYHTLYNHYGHYVFFLPKPASNSLLEWWLPEYHNRCDCVIVPSRATEESLRSYSVTSRIEVIPTGVPIPSVESRDDEARAAARDRFGIPHDAPLLLYAGRLALEKNVELVLEAFSRIADEFPKARLLVVGSGPHEESCLRAASELPCGDRVTFTGALPRYELDPIFAAADLFVFGSGTETQGLVIAEARAVGTPSVVVDAGGASENVVHGEDGFVVPAETEAFSEAIRTVLGNADLRRRMSENCLRNARNYTPSAMAERVQEVYEWAIWHNGIKRAADPAREGRSWY